MKRFLSIEGRRTGYAPDQCGATLTVRELIDFLKEFDSDMEVYLNNDNGYTYGEIQYNSICEEEYEN